MEKTAEQLREEIAQKIYSLNKITVMGMARPLKWEELLETTRDNFRHQADHILSIFLDQTRDDCPECGGKGYWHNRQIGAEFKGADMYCQRCKGTGKSGDCHPERLVVLDEDQSLPKNLFLGSPFYADRLRANTYDNAQQDMLKANFKKIKEVLGG